MAPEKTKTDIRCESEKQTENGLKEWDVTGSNSECWIPHVVMEVGNEKTWRT